MSTPSPPDRDSGRGPAPQRRWPVPRLRPAAWATLLGAILLTAVAGDLYFERLGVPSLFGDEATHAVVAREAAARESPLPLTYRGSLYFNKPPLKILAVAWIFDRFGESEAHARAIDAACGVGTVLTVFLFGRRLWGVGEGLLAASLMMTAEHYLFRHGVRAGVQDSALVLAMTLSLALWFLYRESLAREGGRWRVLLLLASGAAAGCAGLIKGAVVALVPAVVAVWELAQRVGERRRGVRRRRHSLRDLAVLTLLALGPYGIFLTQASRWSGGRLGGFLYRDLVKRNTTGVDPDHLHGALFYPEILGVDFGLWLLGVLPAIAVLAVGRRPDTSASGSDDRRALAFVLLWAALLLAIPSLSASKLPWYIYPAYPAVALVCARGVGEVVRRAARWRWLAAALVALTAFGVWHRVERVRQRVERQERVIPSERYAAAVAELPSYRLILDGRHELRAWHLFYLGPLGEVRRNLPPEMQRPIPGTCRFLLQGSPEAPPGVEVDRPRFAAHPVEGGNPESYLLDLDSCLPHWV